MKLKTLLKAFGIFIFVLYLVFSSIMLTGIYTSVKADKNYENFEKTKTEYQIKLERDKGDYDYEQN